MQFSLKFECQVSRVVSYLLRSSVSSLALGLCLASGGAIAPAAMAGFPAPTKGVPTNTKGGGTRTVSTACRPQAPVLVTTGPASADDQMMLWVKVSAASVRQAEISLFDPQQQGIYQTVVDLGSRSGWVPVTVPIQASVLQPKAHSWSVALICNPQDRTQDWVVAGDLESL